MGQAGKIWGLCKKDTAPPRTRGGAARAGGGTGGRGKGGGEGAVGRAADAAECLIREGVDKAMNRYNG